jgi:hypothetical protein
MIIPLPDQAGRVSSPAMRFLVLLFAAGCGRSPVAFDAPAPVDGPPPPPPIDAALPCLGQPAPTTAPDPLVITGKIFAIDHYDATPLAGAAVALDAATATSDADGAFTLTIASGGHAVTGVLAISASGFVPTFGDPGEPLVGGDLDVLLAVATEDEIARWYGDAGATYAPGARTLVSATVDCARQTIAGSTIAPAAVYYDARAKRWDPALAASTNGFALLANAPASVTLTAHAGADALPPRTVAVADAALTFAVISPRRP